MMFFRTLVSTKNSCYLLVQSQRKNLSVIARSGWVCICFRLVVDFDDIVGQFDKGSLNSVWMGIKKS